MEKKNITRVSIADFEIESNTESLEEIERCINRLIEKNKHFAEFRRKKAIIERSMFG